ncbi:uncharacterized protein FOMMEDRAFT_34290, partial [Fomitiporia mediterranea MF3/22]|uniref:uncharacterized protein n=1 Tax=Fomitiporia mediterranea (strain MF3/22) TaxID=694068 RepID=UPI0004407843
PITYPRHGEVWLAATHHNVTWDTTEVPKDREFTKTAIFLAKEGEVISDEPLASNFSLLDGRVQIQTPTEASGDDFQVI